MSVYVDKKTKVVIVSEEKNEYIEIESLINFHRLSTLTYEEYKLRHGEYKFANYNEVYNWENTRILIHCVNVALNGEKKINRNDIYKIQKYAKDHFNKETKDEQI